MPNEIGSAYIGIFPDLGGFAGELSAGVNAALRGLSGERIVLPGAADALSREFATAINAGVRQGVSGGVEQLGFEFAGLEQQLSLDFETGLRAAVPPVVAELDAGLVTSARSFRDEMGLAMGQAVGLIGGAGGLLGRGLEGAVTHGASFMGDAFATVTAGVGTALSGALELATTVATPALAIAAGILGGGIFAGSNLDKTRSVFTAITGSASTAQQMIASLRATVILTGQDFGQLSQTAQQLLTVGLNPDLITKSLNAVAQIETVTGRGTQGLQRAGIQLQDIALKGVVSGQQLNALARDGIPAYEALVIAAEKSGQLSTAGAGVKDLTAQQDAVTKSTLSLKDAQIALGTAQEHLATAQQNAANAQAKYGAGSSQFANAQRAVFVAQDSVAVATNRIQAAQLGVNDSQNRLTAAQGKNATAEGRANDVRAQAIALMKAGKITAEEYFAALSDPAVLAPFGKAVQAIQDNTLFQLTKAKNVIVHIVGQIFEPVQSVVGRALSGLTTPLGALAENSTFLSGLGTRMSKSFEPLVPLFTRMGDAVNRFVSGISSGGLDKFIGEVKNLLPLAGPLLGLFAALASKSLSGLTFGLVPVFGPLLGIFAGLVAFSPPLRRGLVDILHALQPTAKILLGLGVVATRVVMPALDGLARAVTPLALLFAHSLNTALLGLAWVVGTMMVRGGPLDRLGPTFEAIGRGLAPIIPPLVFLGGQVLKTLAAILLQQIIPAIERWGPPMAAIAGSVLPPLLDMVTKLLGALTPYAPLLLKIVLAWKAWEILSWVGGLVTGLRFALWGAAGAMEAVNLTSKQFLLVSFAAGVQAAVAMIIELATQTWIAASAMGALDAATVVFDFVNPLVWIGLAVAAVALFALSLYKVVTGWQDVVTWTNKGREALAGVVGIFGAPGLFLNLLIPSSVFDGFGTQLQRLTDMVQTLWTNPVTELLKAPFAGPDPQVIAKYHKDIAASQKTAVDATKAATTAPTPALKATYVAQAQGATEHTVALQRQEKQYVATHKASASFLDGIKTDVPRVIGLLGTAKTGLGGAIGSTVGGFFSGVGTQAHKLVGDVGGAFSSLGSLVHKPFEELKTWWSGWWQTFASDPLWWVSYLTARILLWPQDMATLLGKKLWDFGGWVVSQILDSVTQGLALGQQFAGWVESSGAQFQAWNLQFRAWLASSLTQLKDWAGQFIGWAWSGASGFFSAIWTWLSVLPGRVQGWLKSALDWVVDFATKLPQRAWDAATGFLQKLKDGLAGAWDVMKSVGVNIVHGLAAGIALALKEGGSVSGFLQKAIETIRDAFDKAGQGHSPYGLFKPVGRNVVGGVALGITESSPLAHAAIGGLVGSLQNAASVGGALTRLAPAASGRALNITVNVTNPAASASAIANELGWQLARNGVS